MWWFSRRQQLFSGRCRCSFQQMVQPFALITQSTFIFYKHKNYTKQNKMTSYQSKANMLRGIPSLRLSKAHCQWVHSLASIPINDTLVRHDNCNTVFLHIFSFWHFCSSCRLKHMSLKPLQLWLLTSDDFRLRNDLYCVGWGIKLYSLTWHLC